jgi:hypothetical protein
MTVTLARFPDKDHQVENMINTLKMYSYAFTKQYMILQPAMKWPFTPEMHEALNNTKFLTAYAPVLDCYDSPEPHKVNVAFETNATTQRYPTLRAPDYLPNVVRADIASLPVNTQQRTAPTATVITPAQPSKRHRTSASSPMDLDAQHGTKKRSLSPPTAQDNTSDHQDKEFFVDSQQLLDEQNKRNSTDDVPEEVALLAQNLSQTSCHDNEYPPSIPALNDTFSNATTELDKQHDAAEKQELQNETMNDDDQSTSHDERSSEHPHAHSAGSQQTASSLTNLGSRTARFWRRGCHYHQCFLILTTL